ncbi:MAG: acyl-CoA dehydratase activase-related protein [Clostridiaceae bacterium]
MKIGIPRGLFYHKYHPYYITLFESLGCEVEISPQTNKKILNLGTKYCVDEACLPIKIFHGHAAYLKDKCDFLLVPRIMETEKDEYICPKFCGLPEMIKNSIPDIPELISPSLNLYSNLSFRNFGRKSAIFVTKNPFKIKSSLDKAEEELKYHFTGIKTKGSKSLTIALVGHSYNIYDEFVNMNIVNKLKSMGVGIITEEYLDEEYKIQELRTLYKKPFWSYVKDSYGFSSYMIKKNLVNGIIYLSSFACGIDSIVIDLIKDNLKDSPMLVLKLDEQTGETGFNTRLEAFVDMLDRRKII